MSGARADAVAHAARQFDSGGFAEELAALVACPTQSQLPNAHAALADYFDEALSPRLATLGFSCALHENPVADAGPILIARRDEDADLPTVLIYGHGDVVVGQEDRWRHGEPWAMSRKEGRFYGRGTADNKGQHAINIGGLRAVIESRGRLGFNCILLLESDEEMGSRGLREFCEANRDVLAADVLIASDGPRLDPARATVVLGSRGLVNFEMALKLRDGAHHSGNWGGLIRDPGVVLAHALASLTDARGQIAVPEWRPTSLTDDIRDILSRIKVTGGPGAPEIDADWGEEDLTPEERVYGWNSFAVLALDLGDPAKPQNAIAPEARAVCQLRYVVGTDPDDVLPALRRHLDRHGFTEVTVTPTRMAGMKATREDHRNDWVQLTLDSFERTLGTPPALVPNIGGGIPNDVFMGTLGLSTVWVPHSYAGCNQHAPDEHMLESVAREGLQMMAGLFWDIGTS
ncbi:MAG: M20 family metallopeptidase [Alphaproteobacteria bacterium]|nr:M20 family metallopeptidase [Alphaproteobacteria bacterium]